MILNVNPLNPQEKQLPEIADQDVGVAIRGIQEKTDQTTFNLKKIDQEMRHLNMVVIEQQKLLRKLFQNSEKAGSYCPTVTACHESPAVFRNDQGFRKNESETKRHVDSNGVELNQTN